jgi:hypothetical protein
MHVAFKVLILDFNIMYGEMKYLILGVLWKTVEFCLVLRVHEGGTPYTPRSSNMQPWFLLATVSIQVLEFRIFSHNKIYI